MAVLPITPTEVKLGAGKHVILTDRNAGEPLDAGEVVYVDTVTNKWKLGDSNTLAVAKIKGMAINGAALDQPVDVVTKGKVVVGVSAAIRLGGTYVISPTPGKMVEENDILHAIGKFTSFVGIGETGEVLDINPLVSDTALG